MKLLCRILEKKKLRKSGKSVRKVLGNIFCKKLEVVTLWSGRLLCVGYWRFLSSQEEEQLTRPILCFQRFLEKSFSSDTCFLFTACCSLQYVCIIAPKASAEGACILSKMGYSYCYCYCYCYCNCYCFCYNYYLIFIIYYLSFTIYYYH